MEKRGQATLFIIFGIVLVVLVILYFVAMKNDFVPNLISGGDARSEMNDIDNHVSECIQDLGEQYVTQMALQGGYLSVGPDTYRLWNDTTVSYLCWNQENNAMCINRLLTEKHMENELSEVLSEALKTCVNVYDYSDNVNAAQDWNVDVMINRDSVDLYLDYPVTVTKDEDSVSVKGFSESIDAPLGELYDVSMDIVNDEAGYGTFDPLVYMLGKTGRYTTYKSKPYPDTLYRVKLREGSFVFQFMIQGEENS